MAKRTSVLALSTPWAWSVCAAMVGLWVSGCSSNSSPLTTDGGPDAAVKNEVGLRGTGGTGSATGGAHGTTSGSGGARGTATGGVAAPTATTGGTAGAPTSPAARPEQ
jgi:hypothetical protein